jgi:hypothetical protein
MSSGPKNAMLVGNFKPSKTNSAFNLGSEITGILFIVANTDWK